MRSGRLICWLVRLFGGTHKEKRVATQPDLFLKDSETPTYYNRMCQRCGAIRLAPSRQRKTKEAV